MESATETSREPQAVADLREAFRVAGERLAEMAGAYEEAAPDWITRAFDVEVRRGLAKLRSYIEDPAEEGVSWDVPFLELAYPVEWDFEGQRLLYGTFEPEDVADGAVPEAKLLDVLFEARQRVALSRLTRGVVEWREGDKAAYLLPQDVADALDEVTGTRTTGRGKVEGAEAAVEARQKLVGSLARPFAMGEFLADSFEAYGKANPGAELDEAAEGRLLEVVRRLEQRPDLPPRPFTAKAETGETLEGSVAALAYPLVVDATARRAWFTVGVGLVFTQGDPRQFPEEALSRLWADLTRIEEPKTERAPKAEPTAGPVSPRILQDSRVKVDALIARTVGFFTDVKLWRKWDNARRWEALVEEEIDRIYQQYKEEAFRPVPGIRGALLYGGRRRASGERVLSLTKEAESELRERVERRGYIVEDTDADGVRREYLRSRFAAGRGSLTVKFTWGGSARLLSPRAREEQRASILREQEQDASSLPFEGEDALERLAQERNRALRQLGSMNDAARIAPRLLSAFFQQGKNPIHLRADELYLALQCEGQANRLSRVNAALETLRRLEYKYEAKRLGPELSGSVRGSFVTEIAESERRGAGGHGDVVFSIMLSTWAIGCFRVFEQSEGKLKDPRRVFYDWSATIGKDDQKKLDYIEQFSAYASYFDEAAGLTAHQKRLREWAEDQLTRRGDPAARGRKAHRTESGSPDAKEPRVYGSDFCPILPKGRRYHGALGHFARNPETGRRLQGRSSEASRTGGPRAGGLLEVMGYDLPPGRAAQARSAIARQALIDIRAVVEEFLGGVAAAKHRGQWLTLEEASRLPAEALLKDVSWFLFLGEDWERRREKTFEEHHRRRHERGEIDRPYVIAKASTGTASQENVGLDGLELRLRLHAARQERGMSAEAAGRVFGVTRMTISNWERGPAENGKPIPDDVQPLVLRWIETGAEPSPDELKAMAPRRQRGRIRASRRAPTEGGL